MTDYNPTIQELDSFFRTARKLVPILQHEDQRYFFEDEFRIDDPLESNSIPEASYPAIAAQISQHPVFSKYLMRNYYFKEALRKFKAHHYEDTQTVFVNEKIDRQRAIIWLACIVAASMAGYRIQKEHPVKYPSIKEMGRTALAVKKFKIIAQTGALCIAEEKYEQLIKILDESYERIDSMLGTREFMKEMNEAYPEEAIVIPKLKKEREYVFNLYQFYYYQYRLTHTDVIECLSRVELLDISDETLREWSTEILSRPPFRYREDWDEDARKFMLEEELTD